MELEITLRVMVDPQHLQRELARYMAEKDRLGAHLIEIVELEDGERHLLDGAGSSNAAQPEGWLDPWADDPDEPAANG